ncbi:GPI transamidase component Gaa1 [Cryomyces antarcticus]
MSLLSALLALRRDPRILRLPPYVSALCILIGVGWLLLLPLNEYSRQTYVSENAILPGQVHTYFGGSEHNIFRAYRHEVAGLAESSEEERVEKLGDILRSSGLKVATQKYEYTAAGRNTTGKNVYAILQGPRADATEAVVLIAAWRNMDGVLNQSGVALVLTLARYFKRWSVWSKDIIFLIPSDSTAGPQAWVDAYHSGHDLDTIESLPIKSGALQAAVAVDYPAGPWGHRFDKLHIIYDGINGQLPNLDLFNTAVSIASGQMGIGCTIQRMWNHRDNYSERLQTMLRGMLSAGLGHATGPHSSFIPYHVDAITLQTVGDGWHDEMSLGRTVESLFRSLNNLLEHLHQSFFFYLLMHANRFVSIGTYLPGAMLFAVSFTIASVALWVQSGRPTEEATVDAWHSDQADAKKQDLTVVEQDGMTALIPTAALKVVERHMSLPIAFVSAAHFLGLLPLYIFTHASAMTLTTTFYAFAASTALLPALSAVALSRLFTPTSQQWALAACFSLLLLGLFLSALATLNFSLAILVGVLASPLCLVPTLTTSTPSRTSVPSTSVAAAADTHSSHRTTSTSIGGSVANVTLYVLLLATSPPALLLAACRYWNADVGAVLAAAGTAWHVQGAWTGVVVCLVWWPAWLVAAVGVVAARSGV